MSINCLYSLAQANAETGYELGDGMEGVKNTEITVIL